ncbi:small conductance calcium activated potassium [Echinococcus multilocularis]|uniref:Small conductance calcium activated potassium n=1 Tax=Echinococcus multilocularis TaxID=6211 RepID=A0A068YGW6_ECHMU|nr:small conductance calcium activated potassium [Echinococcus multilocularis]
MNTSDIEKLQLAPKKPQLSLLDNDCRLTRINEVEGNEVNPTPFIHSIKPLEELSLGDVGETPSESYQIAHLPSWPATAGVGARTKHLERVSTIASGCASFKESLSISPLHVSRKTSDVNIDDAVRRSPRSRSDNNIAAAYTLSPIIIQTSYLTNENSTELFHPMEGQRPMTSLGVNIKDRGFSASVDDLHDTNFCFTLENPHKDDLNNLAKTTTSSMNAQKKQFIFRAVSESTEDGHASDAEAAAIKRLAEQTPFFGGVRSRCNYCCAMGETAAQLPTHTFRGRCACHESICSCHKQHAVSVVNLPSLRRSRRTPGLDEISYDFMRASGAISGFSQLRSVKGIKHDREKQEMCSAFPPAIVANLDTRGAVALLAASTRPRLIANMRKKTNKAHSSQEEVPTSLKPITWASSFDSSCNIQSQDDDYSRSGPPKWEELACVPMTGKQPALINRNSNYGGSIAQETLLGIKNCKMSAAMERHQSNSTFHNVGYRLGRRRRMFQQRSVVSDYSLVFAVLGILLMIVENELTSGQVVTKDSIWSLMLKSLITCSTLALIGLVVFYHIIVVRILSFDDCIEDWQIAWDRSRVAKLVMEILVCAIHPVPGNFTFSWPSSYYLFGSNILLSCAHCKNGTLDPSLLTSGAFVPRVSAISGSPHVIFPSNKVVSIDIILSLPMFLRLYLIFRVVVLHSKLFTDTGSRSIGAMNKVDFTTQFVFKTFMTICPGTVLVAFILGFWAVLAWMLRACERVQDPVFGNLFNSMWLVAVTFLSIGYGDVVANTYCGRAISIVAGVLGSLCTALVVAVFAKRLELSRAEKHVIHFMMESTLTKQMKYYAANVLRETWLIYKYTKLVKKLNASTIRKHQRKFLRAIHGLRHVKLEQRKLQDNANTLIDLAKTQSIINDTVSEMRIQHTRLQIRLEAIEESLVRIQEQFTTLPIILKHIRMQTRNSSCSNQKSEDRMDLEECCTNQSTTNPYMCYRQTSSRIFNQQGSRATTIRCDDSDLVIHNSAAQLLTNDRLEAAAQSAVSFESTQSHKPPSYARDCLDVEPVQRAISEPPTSFLAAVRQP